MMKNLIFLLILMGSSFKISAQTTLAWYGFDASTMAPSGVDATLVSASNMIYNGVIFNGYGTSMNGLSDRTPIFYNWPVSLVNYDSNKYLEITLTANPGKTIEINGISVWVKMAGGTFRPWDFWIRSSIDNYVGYLYHNYNPTSGGLDTWVFHSTGMTLSISNGSSISFRLYAGNSGHALFGMMAIDSLFVRGQDISTLPIELASFGAWNTTDGVKVNWTTASEQDNDYFVIERSKDVTNWQVVATVDGAGNSQSMINYSIIDKDVPTGLYYYRLSQVDHNGESEVFDGHVVTVMVKARDGPIYPNPAHVGQTVTVPKQCTVIDALGRVLATSSGTFVPRSSGVYFVNSKKLVVK